MSSTAIQPSNLPEDTGTVPVISEYIGVRPGYCGGEPHILGHRIKVRHVAVWHEQMRMSPAEIVVTHPSITLDQVHAALAYYYGHRDEIQAAIAEECRFVDELKAESARPYSRRSSSKGMPRTIRFHLDENADPAVADGLRRHGIDVDDDALMPGSCMRRTKTISPSASSGAG